MRILIYLTILFSFAAKAEYQHGFADTSFNHLDWTTGTQDKSRKRDFNYLELEGGAQFSWGEIYGFYDLENFDQNSAEMRSAAKGTIAYYLFGTNLGLYAQVYNFMMSEFSEQNRVMGLSYRFEGKGWWFKPFLGFHHVTETFFTGNNGYMGGWTIGYMFELFGQQFMLADWHEWEFERNAQYADGNGGSPTGINGAASIWWNERHGIAIGLQWRYAENKLGTPGTLGALISTLRYTF